MLTRTGRERVAQELNFVVVVVFAANYRWWLADTDQDGPERGDNRQKLYSQSSPLLPSPVLPDISCRCVVKYFLLLKYFCGFEKNEIFIRQFIIKDRRIDQLDAGDHNTTSSVNIIITGLAPVSLLSIIISSVGPCEGCRGLEAWSGVRHDHSRQIKVKVKLINQLRKS